MFSITSRMIVLVFALRLVAPSTMAHADIPAQTIRGDLLSIKGDVYVIRDLSGRLVYLRIDKNTKREWLLIPGETIEANVIPGERVIALRPTK